MKKRQLVGVSAEALVDGEFSTWKQRQAGLRAAYIEYTFEERSVLHKEVHSTILQSHQGRLVL